MLQHKYNLNPDIPNSLDYKTAIVQKYDQSVVDSSLKSDAPLHEEQVFLTSQEKDKDFINEADCENIKSNCTYKDWRAV